MEETNMTGLNKLAARILSDAKADAATAEREADETIAAIRQENETLLTERAKESAQKREQAVKSILDGSRTRASLDGRKAALGKKRAVIDQAFSEAYTELLALDAADRGAICRALLLREAEGGELLKPAPNDRSAISAILPELKNAQVTLSHEDADIAGGFLLIGKAYEKDCSFRSVLEELRDKEETNVARLLFV